MTPFQQHVARWKGCRLCPLCDQRQQVVLYRGSLPCEILFAGEAPGESEDSCGVPLKGPAGKMQDGIIEEVFEGLSRRPSIGFANLVGCFPKEAKERGDNEPEHSEIMTCRPRLQELILLAKPRLIVCLGILATEYVVVPKSCRKVDVIHPAAILRSESWVQKKDRRNRAVADLADAIEEVFGE